MVGFGGLHGCRQGIGHGVFLFGRFVQRRTGGEILVAYSKGNQTPDREDDEKQFAPI
jgi:hypothetical protein